MMKTEPPSATGGNGASSGNSGSSSLRSPSPHRNAYEAGLAALKRATDHLNNAANGGADPASKPALLPRPTGRGRKYGSNVHRIKNMFMQMQSPGDEEDGAKVIGKQHFFSYNFVGHFEIKGRLILSIKVTLQQTYNKRTFRQNTIFISFANLCL